MAYSVLATRNVTSAVFKITLHYQVSYYYGENDEQSFESPAVISTCCCALESSKNMTKTEMHTFPKRSS